ncbi:MAG TPA: response regulator transcription factor [Patescibacteria group bacterium]|nr:response regulator transcription factor [Patescibacteria group bacterium]
MPPAVDRHPEQAGQSILLIEDDAALGHMIARVLAEEGFRAQVEATGDTGLEAALGMRPDAVILDLSLPRLDGLDVCRQLRARGMGMPVIMLTARDAVPERVRGLEAGADDYLTKPFAIEELLARLRVQLRRGKPPERLQVADLVLEPATRILTRGAREIHLTAQEFSLLELLMRHRNQVLSRQRILDHVWGYDAAPASNVVDIYIHYLREKVDHGHAKKLITTVRSVGYTLRS